MEYITVQEAAKKWRISDRLVQKYCAEGRIDGIRKFGKSWGIPASAVKPQDPRREKEHSATRRLQPQPEVFPGFMPLGLHQRDGGRVQKRDRICRISLFQRSARKGHTGGGIVPDLFGNGVPPFCVPDLCLCQFIRRSYSPHPLCLDRNPKYIDCE